MVKVVTCTCVHLRMVRTWTCVMDPEHVSCKSSKKGKCKLKHIRWIYIARCSNMQPLKLRMLLRCLRACAYMWQRGNPYSRPAMASTSQGKRNDKNQAKVNRLLRARVDFHASKNHPHRLGISKQNYTSSLHIISCRYYYLIFNVIIFHLRLF